MLEQFFAYFSIMPDPHCKKLIACSFSVDRIHCIFQTAQFPGGGSKWQTTQYLNVIQATLGGICLTSHSHRPLQSLTPTNWL